jgi:hypothetical protein
VTYVKNASVGSFLPMAFCRKSSILNPIKLKRNHMSNKIEFALRCSIHISPRYFCCTSLSLYSIVTRGDILRKLKK